MWPRGFRAGEHVVRREPPAARPDLRQLDAARSRPRRRSRARGCGPRAARGPRRRAASASGSRPGWPSCPVGNQRPASCPSSAATRSWSRLTDGSSPNWSSPTSAAAIASRIAGVGRVTVSERRSIDGAGTHGRSVRRRGGWRRLSSMPADHPIFGRDVPDAAWRPTPELLARLAGSRASSGRPASRDLEALQARAVADPGWFWGAAADDLGARLAAPAGPGRWTCERRARWARWWRGGAFNHAVASIEPRAAPRSRRRGDRLGGRGRRGPPPDERGAARRGRRGRPDAAGAGRRPRAIASGSSCRCSSRPSIAVLALGRLERDLHADLLGLRRAGGRGPARATARRRS